MKNKLNYWTPEEIKILIELYPYTHNKVISKKLNRTILAVKTKAESLNLYKNEWRWSQEEIKKLIGLYPDVDNVTIALQLNKTERSVKSKANKLKLEKNDKRVWTEVEIKKLYDLFSDFYTHEIAKQLNRSEKAIQMKAKRLKLKKTASHKSKCIAKRNKMVGRDLTFEFVKNQALLYKTRGEFQKKDSPCYSVALRNGYLDEICLHMLKVSYSIPQLIMQEIMNVVLNKKCIYNDRKTIRPYELDLYYPDYKLAFEYNGKGWHIKNKNDEIKLKKCKKLHITLVVIKETSRKYEEDVKKQLIFNLPIINKIVGKIISPDEINNVDVGGVLDQIFTKNHLLELAKSYGSYKKFKSEQPKAYQRLSKLKLLSQSILHMSDKPVKYDLEMLQSKISKYKFLGDFIQCDRPAYTYIKKNKLNGLLDGLIRKRREHT